MKVIDNFRGDYAFLSNFYEVDFVFKGVKYHNSEAAFQAQKCPELAEQFSKLSPSEAKRRGRLVPLRNRWDEIKCLIMYDVVEQKFLQNPVLMQRLIKTKDAKLIEGNTWGDRYWGMCNGVGENKLGEILMMVREKYDGQ